MKDELFNYIYDSMNLAMEILDDNLEPIEYEKERNKLDKAIGKFFNWYEETCKKQDEPKKLYLVRQTQPIDYYDQKTIAVFDNLEQAQKLARTLNKEYGCGCVFDDNWDFVELDDAENLHYYDIDEQELNPDLQKYL